MTANQVAYANYVENKRSNLAEEAETRRSNIARETETNRHNLATEAFNENSLAETVRHNQMMEDYNMQSLNEAIRHNMQVETETKRSNLAKETETERTNKQNETIKLINAKITQEKNRADVSHASQKLDQDYLMQSNQLLHEAKTEVYKQEMAANRTELDYWGKILSSIITTGGKLLGGL